MMISQATPVTTGSSSNYTKNILHGGFKKSLSSASVPSRLRTVKTSSEPASPVLKRARSAPLLREVLTSTNGSCVSAGKKNSVVVQRKVCSSQNKKVSDILNDLDNYLEKCHPSGGHGSPVRDNSRCDSLSSSGLRDVRTTTETVYDILNDLDAYLEKYDKKSVVKNSSSEYHKNNSGPWVRTEHGIGFNPAVIAGVV
ncbi:hypothetical protein ABK178_003915 [Salmonella enterica subsp. enterica serovar Brandenburg]|uniref:hypothetical protein n=1 Tax=Salmonella enterica TaxID=28901 RepID=UPI000ABC884A|nr:hypothetical protein [Salmonella enterica]ECB3848095.1 hypothetical protein [Salmonella enterica subsp. enterica serovar Newport]ECD3769267.1 hypothetical protein [Salmonella enterica subsp. enterica serovar Onderstepoort]EDA8242579.1 hypothetical protein [Salmonella enterica subsp. enterica serovar Reading]EDE7748289.1 hypothetical protein [Salmonella enterica subsp. enterica serovar Montevideo]EDL1508968.1 hypothetical protein [Salmonella enterica subsp. enterica serovar Typhimurium]EDT6